MTAHMRASFVAGNGRQGPQRRRAGAPSCRALLLCAVPAALCVLRPLGLAFTWGRTASLQDHAHVPSRVAREAEKDIVVSRQVPLIPRPKKGPKPIVEVPYYEQPHVPDGAERRPGPVRGLVLRKSLLDTLKAGVDDTQRGGLKGRYAVEVQEHLDARKWLVAQGIRENITVFWDHDNFAIPEVYELRPLEALNRYCRWIAGLLGATVTRIETVEYTRYDAPPRMSYLQGNQNLYNSLRQFGGVVHRVWPPMTDGVDGILFERFRHHLDIMAAGGPRSILCLMSQEKGYQAMIEAAQSEGVTVVRVGNSGEMAYFPGGHDFSVPIFWDRWRFAQKEIFHLDLNPFRAESDFAPEHGPKKWHEGPVQLELFDPSEELDRRVFHSFINKKDFTRKGSIVTGTFVQAGVRLNDTLAQAVDRAINVSEQKLLKQPGKGTFYFNEDLEALVEQEPEVAAAVRADLQRLGKLGSEDYAAILWNFDTHWLAPAGPPMQEVLARVVRWVEGFTKVQVKRVEVAKFVEPWVRIGQQALDWFYHQKLLNMTTIRVWPKKPEAINSVLMRDLAAIVRAKKEKRFASRNLERTPRLVVVLTEDLCFDYAMNDAQDAGISAIWLGLTGNGAYYPANTRHRMPFSTVPWNKVAEYLPLAVRDPFLEGVYTPDNYLPVTLADRNSVPADPQWGRPQELDLDDSEQILTPKGKSGG